MVRSAAQPQPFVPSPPPITRAEAARRLGLDQVTKDPERVVLEMCRRGELRPIRVSKHTLVDPVSVEQYKNPEGGG